MKQKHKTMRKFKGTRLIKAKPQQGGRNDVMSVVIQNVRLRQSDTPIQTAFTGDFITGAQVVYYIVEVRRANGDAWVLERGYQRFQNSSVQNQSSLPRDKPDCRGLPFKNTDRTEAGLSRGRGSTEVFFRRTCRRCCS